MKTCTKCGVEKPHAEFGIRKSTGRYRSQCRSCEIEYQRKYLAANPKRNAQYRISSNEWARTNRDRVNAARRERRKDPEYRRNERERDRRRHDPDRWIRVHYKLTRERWEEILSSQGGGCAICDCTVAGGIAGPDGFHVDHDHECCPGKRSCGACVRGLLCNRCNPMLGYARDGADLLRSAASYLDRWKEEASP